MNWIGNWSWHLDGWIVVAGSLCAVASALLGNFLVLRRMSMLGDAISHAVLPGLAAAYFLSESRSSLPMFLGAVIVGVLTSLFTEWIRSAGRVDEAASMGVVFTSLFAMGLILIVQAADRVDLDPGCVLYGAIELTPLDRISVLEWSIPRAVAMLSVVTLLNATFVVVFFKELKISSFDPALATTTGFNAALMHYALMVLVAITAVASFESVGNVLVVAMLVVPPATAYLLTDRLTTMIALSLVIAVLSAVLGHLGAITLPLWFGFQSTTTAPMMAVAAGALMFLAATLGPRHGILVKFVRRRLLAWQILADDVTAWLYRAQERGAPPSASLTSLQDALLADRFSLCVALLKLRARSQVERLGEFYALTAQGEVRARNIVRSHRLWEQYLVSEAGVAADRTHAKAERFEHFTDPTLRHELDAATNAPQIDPHGRPIPQETPVGAKSPGA